MSHKVLNLYAGIGGNRKLWEDVNVVAVEWNEDIASIYKDHFPNDEVIVCDAHEFLEENIHRDWDFIWSSPPCPSHSEIRRVNCLSNRSSNVEPIYPDMDLYEEILFLRGYSNSKWVVENVNSWYDPLIPATKRQRHLFWSNFEITPIDLQCGEISSGSVLTWEESYGFDLSRYDDLDVCKRKILRNCVHPDLGKHVFENAMRDVNDASEVNW